MEKGLKELEKRVSRLENVTGNTYDFYCSNRYLMLPVELLKLGVFNYDDNHLLENIELHKEINKLKQKNKQLEELVTNLLFKLENKEVIDVI